jgi:hypothetical protein
MARAKAEGRHIEGVLRKDAQHELNLTDDETASDVDDVGQAAAGNSPDVCMEPTSALKHSASTGRGNDPFFPLLSSPLLAFPFFPFEFFF